MIFIIKFFLKTNYKKTFYISEFIIYKNYRRIGLGKQIFKYLHNIINDYNLNIDSISLMPYPIEKINDEIIILNNVSNQKYNKLINFYTKCGFEKMFNTKYYIKKI